MLNQNDLLAYLKRVANDCHDGITLISNSGSVISYDRVTAQTLIFSTKGLEYESYDTLYEHMNLAFNQYLQEAYTKRNFKTSTWVRYPDSHSSFTHYAMIQRASDIDDPRVSPIAICLVTQTDLSIIIHFIDTINY